MSRSEGRHMRSCGLLVFCRVNSRSANGLQARSMNKSLGGVYLVTSQPARIPRVGRNHVSIEAVDANDSTLDAAHNRGLPDRYPSIDTRLVRAGCGGCS
jgi:hypothetical protein